MIFRLIVQVLFFFGAMGLLLFGAAGTIAWPGAWAFLTEVGGLTLLTGLWLARVDPELLRERLAGPIQRNQTFADKVVVSLLLILIFASLPIMAMDAIRFRWSSPPGWLQFLGALLILIGAWVSYRTMRQNSFAVQVVKIQTDRGQAVVTAGPYRLIRHPIYFGRIILFFGIPLLLGSFWGLAIAVAAIPLLCVRIYFEEKTLRAELDGYAVYADRVRYRLIPLIW